MRGCRNKEGKNQDTYHGSGCTPGHIPVLPDQNCRTALRHGNRRRTPGCHLSAGGSLAVTAIAESRVTDKAMRNMRTFTLSILYQSLDASGLKTGKSFEITNRPINCRLAFDEQDQ